MQMSVYEYIKEHTREMSTPTVFDEKPTHCESVEFLSGQQHKIYIATTFPKIEAKNYHQIGRLWRGDKLVDMIKVENDELSVLGITEHDLNELKQRRMPDFDDFFDISPITIPITNPTINQTTKKEKTVLPSSKIGEVGEKAVMEILSELNNVQNTSKEGKKADLIVHRKYEKGTIMKPSYGPILVEVKNYKTLIPREEHEKFIRDIEANASTVAGLFVSITDSANCKKFEFTSRSYDGRSVPIITISTKSPEVVRMANEMLWIMLDKPSYNPDKLVKKLKTLSTSLDDLSQSRTELSALRDKTVSSINSIYMNILKSESKIRDAIEEVSEKIRVDDTRDLICPSAEEFIATVEDILRGHWPECIYFKVNDCKLITNNILRKMQYPISGRCLIGNTLRIEDPHLADAHNSLIFEIVPLKTKLKIHIRYEAIYGQAEEFVVPTGGWELRNGCLYIEIDKTRKNTGF